MKRPRQYILKALNKSLDGLRGTAVCENLNPYHLSHCQFFVFVFVFAFVFVFVFVVMWDSCLGKLEPVTPFSCRRKICPHLSTLL